MRALITVLLTGAIVATATATASAATRVTFAEHVVYPVGDTPAAIAAHDLNGDGTPDLAVVNRTSHTVSVLLGNADGTFQDKVDYPAGNTAESVAIADFDGDGAADLAVVNGGGPTPRDATENTVAILRNDGDGTFAPAVRYSTGPGPGSPVVADFNRDGALDIAVVDARGGAGPPYGTALSVLTGNGDGTFDPKVDYTIGNGPDSLTVGDFNGDGWPDLAAALWDDRAAQVLPNKGDGTFGAGLYFHYAHRPWSITAADLDGDGKDDLAMGNDTASSVSLLRSGGRFLTDQLATHAASDYGPEHMAYAIAAADLDGDRAPDLIVTHPSQDAASVLLNDATGGFPSTFGFDVGSYPMGSSWRTSTGTAGPTLRRRTPSRAACRCCCRRCRPARTSRRRRTRPRRDSPSPTRRR